MFADTQSLDIALRGVLLAAITLIWVTVLIRVNGLRTLSKMTNFDFVMTVAMGSLAAGLVQVTKWTDFWQVFIGMAGLVIVQYIAAKLRSKSDTVEDAIQNKPLLIMEKGEINHEALKQARMSESDLIAKLREANALKFEQVCAVVLETTGDVSVLHGEEIDDRLLDGVRCD